MEYDLIAIRVRPASKEKTQVFSNLATELSVPATDAGPDFLID